MKTLFVLIVLLYSNNLFSNQLSYSCKLNTQYKQSDASIWEKKDIYLDISYTKEILKIYDREIDIFYSDYRIVENNSNHIIAIYIDHESIDTFVLNKNTLYAKLSNLFFDDIGGGQISIGECNK